MDASLYKLHTVTRGVTYQYYFSPAQPGKPTLLIVHGFPSTSQDWHKLVAHFRPLGYGLIVPDTLGYGGSSRPTDVEAYRMSLLTKDLVDILDKEALGKVVAIGHDWGSMIVSRLANRYPDRFTAYAFISVTYSASTEQFDIEMINTMTKQFMGYEEFGYMVFFARDDDAEKIIEDHWDSFFSIVYAADYQRWKTDFAPLGGLKAALLADKMGPLPSYLTEEDKKGMSERLRGSFASSLCYYKLLVNGVAADDDKDIAPEAYVLHQPTFWATTPLDVVGIVATQKPRFEQFCKNATVKEYADAGHWVLLSHGEQLAKDLQAWVEGL